MEIPTVQEQRVTYCHSYSSSGLSQASNNTFHMHTYETVRLANILSMSVNHTSCITNPLINKRVTSMHAVTLPQEFMSKIRVPERYSTKRTCDQSERSFIFITNEPHKRNKVSLNDIMICRMIRRLACRVLLHTDCVKSPTELIFI